MAYIRPVIIETGCFLDNHRGHFITRDMIDLAVEYGFIIGPFEKYVLAHYEDWYTDHDDESATDLFQCIVELADEALVWLNCGDNDGIDRAIKGQNSPPIIPEGYAWDWFDGDFGLYSIEDDLSA
jgi:hypothetical protein